MRREPELLKEYKWNRCRQKPIVVYNNNNDEAIDRYQSSRGKTKKKIMILTVVPP